MKICKLLFNIGKINFDNYIHLNLVILSGFSHYRIKSLCCETASTDLWKICG